MSVITQGLGTGYLVTQGYHSRTRTFFRTQLKQLEKVNPSVSYIDYEYINIGLCMEQGSAFQNTLTQLKKQKLQE